MAPAAAAATGRPCPAALSRALLRGDWGRNIPAAGGDRAAGDRGPGRIAPVLRENPELTPQEHRVADLAAEGLTNAEIGAAALRQSAHRLLPPAEGLHKARRAIPEPAGPRASGRGSRSTGDLADPRRPLHPRHSRTAFSAGRLAVRQTVRPALPGSGHGILRRHLRLPPSCFGSIPRRSKAPSGGGPASDVLRPVGCPATSPPFRSVPSGSPSPSGAAWPQPASAGDDLVRPHRSHLLCTGGHRSRVVGRHRVARRAHVATLASPAEVYAVVSSVGGHHGWFGSQPSSQEHRRAQELHTAVGNEHCSDRLR